QDWVHPVPTLTTPGCEEVQLRGILLRTTPPWLLGKELAPITSLRVAMTVCALPPLAAAKDVCPEPAVPSSTPMFRMGQVEKKSRTGDVAPEMLVSVGCRNEALVTPLADA